MYTVVDNIKEIKDMLPAIRRLYVNTGLKYGWKSHNGRAYDFGHWNNQILSNSKYFIYDIGRMPQINKYYSVQAIWKAIQNQIGERCLMRTYINSYTYGTDAYAHIDDYWIMEEYGADSMTETIIVYLNKEWNIDWAGETVLYDSNNEIEKAVLPKEGRVFAFDSRVLHAARPVSRACPALRSVLVFKTLAEHMNSPVVEFILNKTKEVPHSGKTFFDHLYAVMKILEDLGAPKDVAAAGLYHSVYGTEFFKSEVCSTVTRAEVKKLIGKYAEELAHTFCSLTGRLETLLTNSNRYSVKKNKDLLWIEYANLKEQNKNGKYNNSLQSILKALNLSSGTVKYEDK
jgi:hypothetical protein